MMRLQELQPDMITYTLSAERALQASEEMRLQGLQHNLIVYTLDSKRRLAGEGPAGP